MKKFYANGKLLLTGEYFVLDGAQALAIPTKYGQGLIVEERKQEGLKWESYDEYGNCWFQHTYPHFNKQSDNPITERLRDIFNVIQTLNPSFQHNNKVVSTHLTFPKEWGLGTSSTLIALLSKWAEVNPFELLEKTFGGSGYDIACAITNSPILYRSEEKENLRTPVFETTSFDPSFKENLYFVYLDKKQNSRKGIKQYKSKKKPVAKTISEITDLTWKIQNVHKLLNFELLLKKHEQIVSKQIEQPTIQSTHFNYYWGVVKSLGAWGGDFVLATSHKSYGETKAYFNEKGFKTFLRYEEMVLES